MPSLTVSYDNIATTTIAKIQTRFTSLPKPKGNLLVGAFFERPEPTKTKNWFTESPKECIISANIATFPVSMNAAPFSRPMKKFTMDAVNEAMLPCLSRSKISFIVHPSRSKLYYPFERKECRHRQFTFKIDR